VIQEQYRQFELIPSTVLRITLASLFLTQSSE